MAQLYYKFGTMKSGKSMELIKTAQNYTLSDRNVLVCKPIVDTRDRGNIATRMGQSVPCHLLTGEYGQIAKIIKNDSFLGKKYSAVLIDEAQFLQLDTVIELTEIVDELNIPVICFGLKTNFRNELFLGSKLLLELADKIEEIKTVCQFCDKKAIANLRVEKKKNTFYGANSDGDVIAIGDEEYVQVCRKHYFLYATGKVEVPMNK